MRYGRNGLVFVAVLLIGYAASWFIAYSIVTGFDYAFAVEYFVLGWRGGGELPTFIQAAAVIGASLVVLLVWARRTYKRRA